MYATLFWFIVFIAIAVAALPQSLFWAGCAVTRTRPAELPGIRIIVAVITIASTMMTIMIVSALVYFTHGKDGGLAALAATFGALFTALPSVLFAEMVCDLQSRPGGPDSLFEK